MTARPRRSRVLRAALGLLLGFGLLWGVASLLVLGSVHRPARLLGTPHAVRARIALGATLGAALGRDTMLLVGDSRVEALPSLARAAGPPLFAVNAGVSGASAQTWLDLLPPRAEDGPHYGTAVWWAGINDLLYGRADDTRVADSISRVALRLRHHARRVVFVEQIPVRLGSVAQSRALDARITAVNRLVRARLARESGLTVLEIHDQLRGPDGQLARWCSDDGLHLNASGNTWFVQRVQRVQRVRAWR